jgi:pimeloyl-ACP methyl ester carboxylesterase
MLGAALAPVCASGSAYAARQAPKTRTGVRTWTIHYRAHGGVRRTAHVLLPAWYGPRDNPAIPLIISPHGRGLTGRSNAALWGSLPAEGWFAVVNPDGTSRYSWGAPGQIDDLARMPSILQRTLPWLRIDHARIYAFGGSMGGQETLLLVARYPRLLAGAAAFDSVADLALQYRAFRYLACTHACRRVWKASLGVGLQKLAQREIGGSPKSRPRAYAARSPLTFARSIAFSCVPLQLWWSSADRIVRHQRQQSARLFRAITRMNPDAPVQAFTGLWIHSEEMRATSRLPVALATFGLLAPIEGQRTRDLHVIPPPLASAGCTR